MSLKVLAECPMNTILMFQMNKSLLSQDIPEVILLIANLIAIEPTDEQKFDLFSLFLIKFLNSNVTFNLD